MALHCPGVAPRTVATEDLPHTMTSGSALLDTARDLLLFSETPDMRTVDLGFELVARGSA